jgi:hypothetical protein
MIMSDMNPYEFRQANEGQAQGQGPVQNGSPVVRPKEQILGDLRYAPERPTIVTVFGVLNCVFGGLGIICTPFSILGLFVSDLLPMAQQNPMEIAGGYKIFLLISAIVGICFAAWLLALGIGLLKFKSWARRGSVIYACIAIVWGIAGIIISVMATTMGWIGPAEGQTPAMIGGMVGGICGGILGMIYPVLLLIFMQSRKVKEAFAIVGG